MGSRGPTDQPPGVLGLKHEPASPRPEGNRQSEEEPPKQQGKTSVPRRRTSKYCGVCAAIRKNQWQARILMHGKVTHLGYFDSEEEAARVYDVVALSLNRDKANTNFPIIDYRTGAYAHKASKLCGLNREELQRSLGVKPIQKTSRFNGVSKKRGKWVAKVMIDKKLKYHASFEDETEAALAYDAAVRRLKPNKAHAYVNFQELPEVGGFATGASDGNSSEQQQTLPSAPQLLPDLLPQMSDMDMPWTAPFASSSLPHQQLQASCSNHMGGAAPEMMSLPLMTTTSFQPQSNFYQQHHMPAQMLPTSNGFNPFQANNHSAMARQHLSMPSTSQQGHHTTHQQFWGLDHHSCMDDALSQDSCFSNMAPMLSNNMHSMREPHQETCYSLAPQPSMHGIWDYGLNANKYSPLDSVHGPGATPVHAQSLIQPPVMRTGLLDQSSTSSSTWNTRFSLTGEYEAMSQAVLAWQ